MKFSYNFLLYVIFSISITIICIGLFDILMNYDAKFTFDVCRRNFNYSDLNIKKTFANNKCFFQF